MRIRKSAFFLLSVFLLFPLFPGCYSAPGPVPSSSVTGARLTAPSLPPLSAPAATLPPSSEAPGTVAPEPFVPRTENGVTTVDGQILVNKTYSLPRDYRPELTSRDLGEAFPVTPETRLAFLAMREAAQKEGLWLFSVSSWRSYELQEMLYAGYVARDGKEAADRYSARPGHSEHQTGLAIDCNSCEAGFENTPEGIWIGEHCVEFGFILRYPKGKEEVTGYLYEPWHIRYVGSVELARAITSAGTMEEYYGVTSSYDASLPGG